MVRFVLVLVLVLVCLVVPAAAEDDLWVPTQRPPGYVVCAQGGARIPQRGLPCPPGWVEVRDEAPAPTVDVEVRFTG